MFDDREGEQLGQVEDEFSDNDSKSKKAENEDYELQNEEDEKNEEDDPEEEDDEENADVEEKKTKLLAHYSEKLQRALMGDLNSDFPDNVKIVRIFTSSTFTGKKIT